MRTEYQFVLELCRADGTLLDRVLLAPDWEPAVEWTRLAGLRAHGIWSPDSESDPAVEPIWHETEGEPAVSGFRVALETGGRGARSAEFVATKYFGDLARTAAAHLVASGRIAAGDRVVHRSTAFAKPAAAAPAALRFDATDRPDPLVVLETDTPRLISTALAHGDLRPDDIEVIVPRQMLDEVTALTEKAAASETGGVLIGHLHRDRERGELLVEISAQIPARHTVGDSVKLTFTSDTWTDVRAAIQLRRKGEALLGWWHSHPAREWCKACPPERQRQCRFSTGFLSADDRALHRTMFPRAFSLALVVTNALSGIDHTLFGWREGVLEARGFHVTEPACASV